MIRTRSSSARLDRPSPVAAAAAALSAAALSLVGGCGPTAKRTAPATMTASSASDYPPLPTGQDLLDRAADARRQAAQFELLAGRLREADPARQRPVVRDVFVALADLLPTLAGPRRSGVFAHQYAVVTSVRDQLGNRPERLSDDGLLDDGLGAAYNALRDLSYNDFYADPELGQRLDGVRAAVGRLRLFRGADHGLVVADVVTQAGGVLSKMAGTFYERVTASPDSATQPGGPAAPATTAPATEPVPAPVAPGK